MKKYSKMTAVEFIAQELSKQIDNNLFMEVEFNKLLEQAKEIQFQQMKKSYYTGLSSELHDHFEKYYEDTYSTVNKNEGA